MKLVCMSDSHNSHHEFVPPEGDILIHAGDLTMQGTVNEVIKALDWLKDQTKRYKYVIFIAGNHDFMFEKQPDRIQHMAKRRGLIYLNDSGTEIEGLKFWGSPITPWFHD